MKQELGVLTTTVNAQQASKREEKICCIDDIRNRTAAPFIQSCWRRLLARKELQRLQKKAKELSIQLLGDSRTNHLEERGNDTDANLVITWSRNPHAKTPIPGKPSKSGLIVV